MLAVRKRPDDCSCLSLLGTARGDTWWQVSEASWDRPRGTGPGFWRESHSWPAIARRFGVNAAASFVISRARVTACTDTRATSRQPFSPSSNELRFNALIMGIEGFSLIANYRHDVLFVWSNNQLKRKKGRHYT